MFKSKQKGNNFERKLAKMLSEAWGIPLIRTPCSGALKNFCPADITPEQQSEYENWPLLLEAKNRVGWHLEQLISSKSTCPVLKWWEEEEEKQYKARGLEFYNRAMLLIFTKNHDDIYVMFRVNSSGIAKPYKQLELQMREINISSKINFFKNVKCPVDNKEYLDLYSIMSLKHFLEFFNFHKTQELRNHMLKDEKIKIFEAGEQAAYKQVCIDLNYVKDEQDKF